MMRLLEYVETVRIGRDTIRPRERRYHTDADAAEILRMGWAVDADTGDCTERQPQHHAIQPDDIIQQVTDHDALHA